MKYEELDYTTRRWMLEELREEEAHRPYHDPGLSAQGRERFPLLLREAI